MHRRSVGQQNKNETLLHELLSLISSATKALSLGPLWIRFLNSIPFVRSFMIDCKTREGTQQKSFPNTSPGRLIILLAFFTHGFSIACYADRARVTWKLIGHSNCFQCRKIFSNFRFNQCWRRGCWRGVSPSWFVYASRLRGAQSHSQRWESFLLNSIQWFLQLILQSLLPTISNGPVHRELCSDLMLKLTSPVHIYKTRSGRWQPSPRQTTGLRSTMKHFICE